MEMNVNTIFDDFQKQLDSDTEIREEIKIVCDEIYQLSRVITDILQEVHYNEEETGPACLKARAKFEIAREGYLNLKNAVPCHDYYKFYDQWRTMTQRYCFLISFTIWLEMGIMASYNTVAEVLGLSTKEEITSFHLNREDYLVGLLILCSELARLASSFVSQEEYSRPLQISKFVMEVNSGFRLLNLKNDYLRKRYDALKYDVKKIEGVIYDLRLRGLLNNDKNNAKEGSENSVTEGQENGKTEDDLKNGVAEGQEKGVAEKSLRDGKAEGQENENAAKDLKNRVAEGQENENAAEDLKNRVAEGQENENAAEDLKNRVAEGQENENAEENLRNRVAEGQDNVKAKAGGDADKYDDAKK